MTKYLFTALLSLAFSTQIYASSTSDELDQQINSLRTFFNEQNSETKKQLKGIKNIHVFNKERTSYSKALIFCNSELCSKEMHNSQTVLANLVALKNEHCPFSFHNSFPKFDEAINELSTQLKAGKDFDIETGMHVSHMLSSIWNYIRFIKDKESLACLLPKLFYYIDENITMQGGCFEGFAGRLMISNVMFAIDRYDTIMKEMHNARLIALLTPAHPTEHIEMSEEEQVRLAIAMSQPQQAPAAAAPVEMSEEDLQLYLAMAMSNDEK